MVKCPVRTGSPTEAAETEAWNVYLSSAHVPEKEKARNKLVAIYWPLTFHTADQIARLLGGHSGYDSDDVRIIAAQCIIKFFDTFDPNRGINFTGYMLTRIRWRILDAIRAQGDLPRHTRRKNMALPEMEQTEPSGNAALPIVLSLDRAQEEFSYVDALVDDTDVAKSVSMSDEMVYALDRLPPRYRDVVHRVYVEGQRYTDVATALGVSAAGVCHIHREAIRMMRQRLNATESLPPYTRLSPSGKQYRQVKCVETGAVYPTAAQASRTTDIPVSTITYSLRYSRPCGGLRWVYDVSETPRA